MLALAGLSSYCTYNYRLTLESVLPAIYLSQSVMEQVALSNQMLYVEIHYIEFSKLLV